MSRRRALAGALVVSALPIAARAQSSMRGVDTAVTLDTTGATDMTAALQSAVDAAGTGSLLRLPAGRIRIEGTVVVPYDRQHWVGAGRGATRLVFAPNRDATMLRFGKATNITPQQSLQGMTITTEDTTYAKTALELVDTSHFQLNDIEITGTKAAAGTLAWSGGRMGSIGIRTYGREAPRFGGGCYVSADNPLRISRNKRAFNPQIDADFFSLRDVYFIANGQPVIIIDGDVELLNFLLDGGALVRGSNAIRWIGADAKRATSGFSVRNTRWEQAEDSKEFAFDLQPSRNLYGLTFDNVTIPPAANGFRLRNCVGPVFRQVTCGMNTPREVLNVDATVRHMRHENCYWGVNTTCKLDGQRLLWALSSPSTREPMPRDAVYDTTAQTGGDLRFDGALGGKSLSLDPGEVAALSPGPFRGCLFVVDSEGNVAQLHVRRRAMDLQMTSGTSTAAYTTKLGAPRSSNIYWSDSNRRIEIQNLKAHTINYRIIPIGFSTEA